MEWIPIAGVVVFFFGVFVGRLFAPDPIDTPVDNAVKEPPSKDPFADKVKCTECSHYVDKSDAQVVALFGYYGSKVYYCPMHKKPYSRMDAWGGTVRYYGEVEMTKEGKPIAPKKK